MKTTQDKNQKKSAGRKWFDGKDEEATLTKCKEAWALGCSDAEAAFYAEITGASLSRYLDAHDEVREFRNALHQKPILKARQTVIKNLDDPNHAKWYLERKVKNEFSPKTETDITTKGESINTSFVIPPEAIKIIEDDLKKKKIDEL